MPEWENLRFAMPTWERIHQIYDNTHKSEKPTGTNTGKKIAAALVLTGTATVIPVPDQKAEQTQLKHQSSEIKNDIDK